MKKKVLAAMLVAAMTAYNVRVDAAARTIGASNDGTQAANNGSNFRVSRTS